VTQPWLRSSRGDKRALPLADRHYNRQKIGAPQFVPPGRCLVLMTADAGALWVTSWPLPQYVKHEWAGAWVNSLFRNERPDLYRSSELILEACAATRAVFGEPPGPHGMVTFIDAGAVRPKRDPGRCYRRAGFDVVGRTKEEGHVALVLPPDRFPAAVAALGSQSLLREAL
jgi:hypothetical protein